MQSNTCLCVASLAGIVDFRFLRCRTFEVELPFRDGLLRRQVARVIHWDLFGVVVDVRFIDLERLRAGDSFFTLSSKLRACYLPTVFALHTDKAS